MELTDTSGKVFQMYTHMTKDRICGLWYSNSSQQSTQLMMKSLQRQEKDN